MIPCLLLSQTSTRLSAVAERIVARVVVTPRVFKGVQPGFKSATAVDSGCRRLLAFSSPVEVRTRLFLKFAPNLDSCNRMALRACTLVGCGHGFSVLRQDNVTSCYPSAALGVNKVMNRRTNELKGDSIIRVVVVRHFPGATVSRYCESAFDG